MPPKKKYTEIKDNESPGVHDLYVWDNFVAKCSAKVVAAVAHSAGGAGAVHMLRKRTTEFSSRVCGIAFTDSAHSVGRLEPEVSHYVQKRCRSWVTSDKPLDTKIAKPRYDCLCVSAGHTKHEYTSGYAVQSVFVFLLKRMDLFLQGEDPNDTNYDRISSSEEEEQPQQKEQEKETPKKEKPHATAESTKEQNKSPRKAEDTKEEQN